MAVLFGSTRWRLHDDDEAVACKAKKEDYLGSLLLEGGRGAKLGRNKLYFA